MKMNQKRRKKKVIKIVNLLRMHGRNMIRNPKNVNPKKNLTKKNLKK